MKSSDVYGFNYDGSWGTSGLDVWQHHDHGTMAVEIARGKAAFPKWNTARWWLSHEAYQRNPERFLANFEAGLTLFASHDILVMPVIFNRWRDPVCDFGGVALDHIVPGLSSWTRAEDLFDLDRAEGAPVAVAERLFTEYLEGLIGAYADDQRIYSWDLCNEPLMGTYGLDPENPIRIAELTWLTWVYKTCKKLGATQPLTIGNYPHIEALRATEHISDILSMHPYWMWNSVSAHNTTATKEGFEKYLDECVAIAEASGKGLIGNETVWGANDDEKHVEVMRYTLGELKKRGIGFTAHALHHSLIADLHRAEYGPVGWPETLHFIEADGTVRKGHEAFNEFAPTGE
ncbi:glycoside hydrolase 5 family protein [Planctomonas psychrotolerans]|uniref:hypothetical protein n=1 Tax=Planctomonas psychrotolerans TaxID=2528712 RepID=UPI00123B9C07|nr:hypothetical protein [Planctomonas psychrotolerans]